MSDGKIVFDTAINNDGTESDLKALRKDVEDAVENIESSSEASSKKVKKAAADACSGASKEAKKVPKAVTGAAKEAADGVADASRDVQKSSKETSEKIKKDSQKSGSAIDYLRNAIDKQSKKLQELKSAYAQVTYENGKHSDEAKKLAKQIKELSSALADNKKSLQKAEDAAEGLDKSYRDIEKSGSKLSKLKGIFTGLSSTAKACGKATLTAVAAFSAVATIAVTSLTATADSTRDYRTEMGKLNTAFTQNSFTSEQAKETYKELVGILGETDQAVEAANHLAKLTKNEKDLNHWTDICAGVYATFGASLPIEGLTEAANETAKVGKVTGPLADALNWAGVSEDAFNKSLEKCSTEQERQALITSTLTGLYADAADAYRVTNAQVIEANRVNDELSSTLAAIGEQAEPLSTDIKSIGVALLEGALEPAKSTVGFLRGEVIPVVKGYADQLKEAAQGGGEALADAAGTILADAAARIASGTPTFIKAAANLVTSFAKSIGNNADKIAASAVKIVKALASGIVKAVPQIEKAAAKIVTALAKQLLGDKAGKAVKKLTDSVRSSLNEIFKHAKTVINAIKPTVVNLISIISSVTKTTLPALKLGFKVLEPVVKLLGIALEAVTWGIDKLCTGVEAAVDWIGEFVGISDDAAGKSADLARQQEHLAKVFDDSKESVSGFFDSASSATSAIEDMNDEIFVSSTEQSRLSSSIAEVQAKITSIASTATSERRKLTQSEIDELDRYFEKLAELTRKQYDLYFNKSEATIAMIEGEDNWSDELVQSYVAAAQEIKDEMYKLAQEDYANTCALINQKHKAAGTLNTEAYYAEIAAAEVHRDEMFAIADGQYSSITGAAIDAYAKQTAAQGKWAEKSVGFAGEVTEANFMLKGHLEHFQKIMPTYGEASAAAFDKSRESLQYSMNEISETLYGAEKENLMYWLNLVGTADMYGGVLSDETVGTLNDILAYIDELPPEMKKEFEQAWLGAKEAFNEANPEMLAAAEENAESYINKIDEVFEIHSPSRVMMRKGEFAVQGFIDGSKSKTSAVTSVFKSLAEAARNAVKGTDFHSVGRDMADGLANGIRGGINKVIAAAKAMANNAIASARKAADSHSPSRKTFALGEDLDEGLKLGIEKRMPQVAKTAYEQAAELVDRMRAAVYSRRAALEESVMSNVINRNTTNNNYDNRQYPQNFNFYTPTATPAQVARAARLAMEVT